MKFLKKCLKILVVLFGLLIAVLYITDTDYLIKAVRTIYMRGYTTAFLDDYHRFDNKTIAIGTPQPWQNHKDYNTVTETKKLTTANKDWGTVAYVIIKNDSALMEGHIKSLDQPVCEFLPAFCDGDAGKMTVGDLSTMSSGTNWDEAYYSPFSITTRAYFDDDLAKVMNGLKVVTEPGQAFKYSSGDTQMLAMVIEKATGKKLYNYLEESFWKPLGCENQTRWQLDSDDHDLVKAYCCIASNAKDFARFGKLYKDYGKWNGQQVLDSAFVAKSLTPKFKESPIYGYGWWLKNHNGKNFKMMRGHLGQYVIVQPEDNVIIVRLGHQKSPGSAIGSFTDDISLYINEAYNMLNK